MNGSFVRKLGKIKAKYNQYRYPDWYFGSIMNKIGRKTGKSNIRAKGHVSTYNSKPGIAFSFDDSFRVKQWYQYGKGIFGYNDVKVTFNINGFHHFEGQREHTQEEVDMLLELQANGHEIAHHGFKHQNASSYGSEKGLSRWIEDDIKPLFDWMEKQEHSMTQEKFKRPVSYAFPFSEYNEGNINELVPHYFKIVRGHLREENLLACNHTGVAPSVCIDNKFLSDMKYVKKIMKMAKSAGKHLIFMCHSILPEEKSWEEFEWGEESAEAGEWRISPNTIKAIIDEARKLNMGFYTTSEIAGVATFIDRNLENCVRQYISNPTDPWISISELSRINALDFRGKDISNLDGIQYLINLEKLSLEGNPITDFRLLKRLSKLKEIDILVPKF